MFAACRNRHDRREPGGKVEKVEGEGEPGAALVCGQKLLFPYKAPLSRTILLEWLRKMPNQGTLGIAVSSAAVSSDRGKNATSTLGLDRFRPTALAATVAIVRRNCGCSFSFVCPCPCSLYIAVVLRRAHGAREHFSSRVSEYMANVRRKESVSWRAE